MISLIQISKIMQANLVTESRSVVALSWESKKEFQGQGFLKGMRKLLGVTGIVTTLIVLMFHRCIIHMLKHQIVHFKYL